MMNMFNGIARLFHTVKYLKPRQVWYRVYYRLVKPKPLLANAAVRRRNWKWHGPNTSSQSLFDGDRVKFLGLEGDVAAPTAWNDASKDKLWLYNLHYFDDLSSVNFAERDRSHYQLIDRWIQENAPLVGNGWEPYPISLRLVNWIKWFSKKDYVENRYLSSIYGQASALADRLEYHILGNHLFANAKALAFAGCFLEGGRSDEFLRLSLHLLDKEIEEQFLSDGAHFELSPMYHGILLWDLLELIDLAGTAQNDDLLDRLPSWRAVVTKSLRWLKTMIHPDGEVSFFNDAAIGVAPNPGHIFQYAKTLGIEVPGPLPSVVINHVSGYSRIAKGDYALIIDHAKVGPDYLPGHAHADTLSFELSVGRQRVFVNSGTSQYGVSEERLRQRKTAAHNTVEVDGADSSEVWSGFRVARRARPILVSVNEADSHVHIESSHDGYRRLRGALTHTRIWRCDNTCLTIKDRLSGKFKAALAYYHVHPDVVVKRAGRSCQLILPNKKVLDLAITAPFDVENSTWHPEFGKSVPSKRLVVEFDRPEVEVAVYF